MLANPVASICRFLAFCLLPSLSWAAPSPCRPPEEARLDLAYARADEARLKGVPARAARERRQWAVLPGRASGSLAGGFGHAYSILDMEGLDAAGNGHLHTLFLPLDLPLADAGHWRLRLQPALSVSSNLLKDPGGIRPEAWQVNAALLRRLDSTAAGQWEAGLCADHRFGDYQLYPVLAWRWRQGPLSLRLGWPDSHLAWRASENLAAGLRLFPDGNRWQVHDDEAGDSTLRHEAWRAQWYLDWRAGERWGVELSVGRLLRQEFEFSLAEGGRVREEGRPAFHWGLRLHRALGR